MNFEGKRCGVCDKGLLKKTMDEVAEGVFVEAYKCGNCGGVSYSRQVMEKIEALERERAEERHVVQVGSSLAVPIPMQIIKKLGLKARERVFVLMQDGKIIVKPNLMPS